MVCFTDITHFYTKLVFSLRNTLSVINIIISLNLNHYFLFRASLFSYCVFWIFFGICQMSILTDDIILAQSWVLPQRKHWYKQVVHLKFNSAWCSIFCFYTNPIMFWHWFRVEHARDSTGGWNFDVCLLLCDTSKTMKGCYFQVSFCGKNFEGRLLN